MTYAEARPWAVALKEEILRRRMPPWGAIKGFGDFRNDQALTPEEMERIVSWTDGGVPEGEAKDLPPPPKSIEPETVHHSKSELKASGDFALSKAFVLDGVWPEQVPEKGSFQITAQLPDGTIQPLLWLKDYKMQFAHPFLFQTPLESSGRHRDPRHPGGRENRAAAREVGQASLVTGANQLTGWQRWVRQPQKVWLRRALFQAHLWSGIAAGLYILMMSVTGSVLVYRNELYRAATSEPIISTGPGPRLTDDQLAEAAGRVYPGYRVVNILRPPNPDQAVEVSLRRGGEIKKRLFDVRSGSDLGNSISALFLFVSELLDLHDNLLAGSTGRTVNGAGAFAVLVVAVTGLVIWWPGIKTWRRSLILRRGVGWKRQTWQLHSAIGFWSLGFTLIFGLSGVYLCFPQQVQDLADWLEPPTVANAGVRIGRFSLHTGSPICTSAASTASGFLVAARGCVTRRPRRFGRSSDWPPRRCS